MSVMSYKDLIAMLGDGFQTLIKEQRANGFSINKSQLKKSLDFLRFLRSREGGDDYPIDSIQTYYEKEASGLTIGFVTYGLMIYYYEMEEFARLLETMWGFMVMAAKGNDHAVVILYTIPNVFIKGN